MEYQSSPRDVYRLLHDFLSKLSFSNGVIAYNGLDGMSSDVSRGTGRRFILGNLIIISRCIKAAISPLIIPFKRKIRAKTGVTVGYAGCERRTKTEGHSKRGKVPLTRTKICAPKDSVTDMLKHMQMRHRRH